MPTHHPHPSEARPSEAKRQPPATPREDEELEREPSEAEAEEVDRDEIEALMAIARLDMEAAAAYEVAASAVDDAALRRLLERFQGDHERHVADLTSYAKGRGFDVRVTEFDPESSVLVGLVSSVGAIDPDAVLEAMVGNEQLTNATYETALWLVSDDDAQTIVQRNRDDERRHLEALLEYAKQHES